MIKAFVSKNAKPAGSAELEGNLKTLIMDLYNLTRVIIQAILRPLSGKERKVVMLLIRDALVRAFREAGNEMLHEQNEEEVKQ